MILNFIKECFLKNQFLQKGLMKALIVSDEHIDAFYDLMSSLPSSYCDIGFDKREYRIPIEISSKEELDPKKYGVIVTKGYKRGLLLPNLEGVNTIEDQLHIACDKAGIDYFNDDFHIERFEVIRYEE